MQTVLITGCSSGFGLEIARHFLERDWHVVATMRTPDAGLLPPSGEPAAPDASTDLPVEWCVRNTD